MHVSQPVSRELLRSNSSSNQFAARWLDRVSHTMQKHGVIPFVKQHFLVLGKERDREDHSHFSKIHSF